MDKTEKVSVDWSIDMPNNRYATIVMNTLNVDKEISEDKIQRNVTVDGDKLRFSFQSNKENVKILRTAISAFIVNLKLSLETIKQFGN